MPPTTHAARSQDRYEESRRWVPYRRRGGRSLRDSYWEYQKLRWSLGGLGIMAAGLMALFTPSLFWGGLVAIGIGALWTWVAFGRD
jgi:hypothetical protein